MVDLEFATASKERPVVCVNAARLNCFLPPCAVRSLQWKERSGVRSGDP
jgi:hypothetical protein